MRDCAEVFKVGATAPGHYQLDTSGQMNNNDHEEVFCEEGWTRILSRNGEDLAARGWERYYDDFKEGFRIGQDFWIGLDRLSE